MLSWQALDCPTCGVPMGEHCRTLKTGKRTETHMERYWAWEKMCKTMRRF